jgi:glucose-6-phosphate 1-dehydrogenase
MRQLTVQILPDTPTNSSVHTEQVSSIASAGIAVSRMDIDTPPTSALHEGEPGWTDFETRLRYMVGDISDPKFYAQLRVRLEEMEKNGSSPNHLFYVSTPASVAGPIIEGLGAVGLNRRDKGWTRIVLEKPFGRDLESAHSLNDVVRGVFDEKTVYRIDHYLGKETVQNILVFRFRS